MGDTIQKEHKYECSECDNIQFSFSIIFLLAKF